MVCRSQNCLCVSRDDKKIIKKIKKFLFKTKTRGEKYTKSYIKKYNQYLVEAETWENVIKTPRNIQNIKKLFASKLENLF